MEVVAMKSTLLKYVVIFCGIGLASYLLSGLVVFCVLFPFGFHWIEIVGWGFAVGVIMSTGIILVKVHSDQIHSKGLYEVSEAEDRTRTGWNLERVLVVVIPFLAFAFGTVLVFKSLISG